MQAWVFCSGGRTTRLRGDQCGEKRASDLTAITDMVNKQWRQGWTYQTVLVLHRRPTGKVPTPLKKMFLLDSTKFRKQNWDAHWRCSHDIGFLDLHNRCCALTDETNNMSDDPDDMPDMKSTCSFLERGQERPRRR